MTEREALQALVRKWRGSRSVLVQGCASELARAIALDQPALPMPTGRGSAPASVADVQRARRAFEESRRPVPITMTRAGLKSVPSVYCDQCYRYHEPRANCIDAPAPAFRGRR